MTDIWFISDHHFNHANILSFTGADGKLIRPGWKDINHMNEVMIERHNSVVKPHDKVYFGGDIGRNFQRHVSRMNGRKRLILGNHDDLHDVTEYREHFEKVLSWRFFGHTAKKFVVSHYPLHPMSFAYRGGAEGKAFNVHGHIHEKHVLKDNGHRDTRYFNICVEKLDYTPIHLETLLGGLRHE